MRLFRHLFARSAQSWLPEDAMARITQAIDAGELRHSGEICFAVEPALHWRHILRGTDPRARAEQAFAKLRVWDTEANTGVLLYVLLADHRLEIVAVEQIGERCRRVHDDVPGAFVESAGHEADKVRQAECVVRGNDVPRMRSHEMSRGLDEQSGVVQVLQDVAGQDHVEVGLWQGNVAESFGVANKQVAAMQATFQDLQSFLGQVDAVQLGGG